MKEGKEREKETKETKGEKKGDEERNGCQVLPNGDTLRASWPKLSYVKQDVDSVKLFLQTITLDISLHSTPKKKKKFLPTISSS